MKAMFQEERTYLLPLPIKGSAYFTECERTVGDDTCIRLDHSSYAGRSALKTTSIMTIRHEHGIILMQ